MLWLVSSLRWRRRNLLLPQVAVTCWLAFSLGACGAGDRPRSSLRIDAAGDGSLRFERSAVRAAAGRARIEMRNPSNIPHAIGVRGEGVEEIGETVGKGGTSSVEADLEPGAYELFCPVGSHEQAGMTARLVIR
jgi:plastocyanin